MIDIEAPEGLNAREFAAFRLGMLKTLLRVTDHPVTDMPGIYREAFTNELEFRKEFLAEGKD